MSTKQCTYTKKGIYLLITIPLTFLYLAVAYYLWHFARIFFWIYLAFFILINPFQSYACAYRECIHMYGFCPGIGGFIIPASRIARLFRNRAQSRSLFIMSKLIVALLMLGIIAMPLFFLKDLGILLVLLYCSIFVAYIELSMNIICPSCASNSACVAGISSSKIIKDQCTLNDD